MEDRIDEAKKLAKSFVEYVYMKEPLKTQFFVYDNLRNAHIENDSSSRLFIQESLSLLSDISLEDALNYNKLLESRFKIPRIASSEIDTHIHRMIKARLAESEDYDKVGKFKSFEYLVEYVKKEKIEQDEISRSPLLTEIKARLKYFTPRSVTRIAIKQFNKEYGSLFTEQDRHAFLVLKDKNPKRMAALHKELSDDIAKERARFLKENTVDKDLANKLVLAEQKIKEKCSAENILNALDLLENLKGYTNVSN
jgi:hypothetical protein